MKKILILLVVVIFLLFGGGFLYSSFSTGNFSFLHSLSNIETKPLTLNQEDVSRITEPSVVSIYHQMKGKIIVPFFDIDWDKLDLIFPTKKEPFETDLDEYSRGSGFIISNDGYILTNAHVVSDVAYKEKIALQLVGLRFLAALSSEAELKKMDVALKAKNIKPGDEEQFGENLAKDLSKKLVDKIKFNSEEKIIVLNPSSNSTKLSELIEGGFATKVVSVNKNFLKDQKDVAILKISGTNFPTVDIDSDAQVNVGDKIYIYGFPASGQFNSTDVLKPTFTEGTISGIKDSDTKEFKVFQTSAKVSPGSSGGPVFNKDGKVIGILTYATSSEESGDSFSFATPIHVAESMLDSIKITSIKNPSSVTLLDGIQNLENNRCRKALDEFNTIEGNTHKDFYQDKIIRPYKDKCLDIIAQGNSIDNTWDEVKLSFRKFGNHFWILAGVILAVAIIVLFVIIKLLRRLKHDENELKNFQYKNIVPVSTIVAKPESFSPMYTPIINNPAKPVNPTLLQYVKTASGLGVSKETIAMNLKVQGWSEEDIKNALAL